MSIICIQHIFSMTALERDVIDDSISRVDRSIQFYCVLEIRIWSAATAGSIEPAGPGTGSNLNVKDANLFFALARRSIQIISLDQCQPELLKIINIRFLKLTFLNNITKRN